MDQTTPQIGPAVQRERKARKLTLEQLAGLSGVSKSMLSQIERGEANPTFAVLWSLTEALGIAFDDLIAGGQADESVTAIEVVSSANTPEMRSADGLCTLKILSPPRLAGKTEWYELIIAPGGTLESAPHSGGTFEHFTAWDNDVEITSGDTTAKLSAGETARYAADVPHAICNVGTVDVHGLLVVLHQ